MAGYGWGFGWTYQVLRCTQRRLLMGHPTFHLGGRSIIAPQNQKSEISMSLALATEHPVKLPVIGSHRELWAQTIGCRVPRGSQSGRVDAGFEHACNVPLYSGELVVVLGCRTGNVAHAIRLTRDYRFDQE